MNACWLLNRTAFKKALQISSGGVCRADQTELHRLLPVYKPKQREGVIERVEADGCTAVCRHATISVGNTCTFGAALSVPAIQPTCSSLSPACVQGHVSKRNRPRVVCRCWLVSVQFLHTLNLVIARVAVPVAA